MSSRIVLLLMILKAILSQFSQKKKALDDDSDTDSDDDEDECLDGEEAEDEDDVDADREANDELFLEEIAREVGKLHILSAAEDNLGRSAMKKVQLFKSHI